jgi:hypothetical protein
VGGHTSIDYELWVKVFREKVGMEKSRRPKVEVPKWTRVIDLRWKAKGESVELPKCRVPKWISIIDREGG